MPPAAAPGPSPPRLSGSAADPDSSFASETVSEHPLADFSATQLSDGEADVSIPMTVSTRPTMRASSVAPSPSRPPLSPSPAKVSASTLRRPRRLRYIRSHASSTSSPHRRRRSGPTEDHLLLRERMDRLVIECNDAAAGHMRQTGPLHADMLEAIATQERLCLELREALKSEEVYLKNMRDVWQRMALRVGIGANSLPARVPRMTQRPTPPVPAAVAPVRDSPSRSDARFMPSHITSQLHALVEPRSDSAQAAPSPPSSRSPGKDSPAYRVRQKRLPPIHTHTAKQPAVPSKDDLSAEVLREKLSNGWHVLSRRLIETTASFKDLSWVADDVSSSAPSSRLSLPPLFSDDTNVGALSRYDTNVPLPRTPSPNDGASAPPLPPKSPSKSRPALATSVAVGVPEEVTEPLGEASMAGPIVSEAATHDAVSPAVHDEPLSGAEAPDND
ncbi:hypothetical protein MNAN1_001098 [Malassezia nana]|uniref:Uncharacterized protein n=1 Tax=Malassezia nana TaxID=180528 RepID=A0AAF0J2W9_9BASI|nr:hypothetical protein MNAN1_001098 [Malassezia nana]